MPMGRGWRHIKLAGLLLAVGVAAWTALTAHRLQQPLELEEERIHRVRSGQSLNSVLDELQAQGILDHALEVRLFLRFSGRGERIHAGEYRLTPGLTPLALLDKLERGDVYYRSVILVEGWTAIRALKAIQAHPHIESTISAADPEELRLALGLERHPEGLFFPDTYHFTRGTPDREILQRAYAQMQQVLAQEWPDRDVGLPYDSEYEALIMASLVEKETAVAMERRRIAGVFVRRLQQGMRLQTDPTVIYGLGEGYAGNLTRAHLETDTPYNTYLRRGLPPTPIALPGREAIYAALHPEEGQDLYFVSKGDGTHHFSATLEEHNAAVRRYQLGEGGLLPGEASP